MGLGMRELVVILLVVMVVFGAKKLRTVGSDLGHAMRGFKKAMSEGEVEQNAPPKEIRSEDPDAKLSGAAKESDKTERSA